MLLRLMITDQCHNNCEYCFVKTAPNYGKISGELDIYKAEHQLKQAIDKGINMYEIVGGEPFSRPDLIKWFLDFNKDNGNFGVSFFSSGNINVTEIFDLLSNYDTNFMFNFSYDGSKSKRNSHDYEIVQNTITLFKTKYPTGVRFSINKEDIKNFSFHYQEIAEMGVPFPIMFPMKYADYTQQDIDLFCGEYDKMLDYCIANEINHHGVIDDNDIITSRGKKSFGCPSELTLLPNNKWANCYVALSSFGYPDDMISDELKDFEPFHYVDNPPQCDKCLESWGACNNCPGNLKEYQRKTGNDFYHSYCALMNKLTKVFIRKKLECAPHAKLRFGDGVSVHTEFFREGDDIIMARREII